MSSTDHSREPCPLVILNDLGGAFVMGGLGGVIWHGVKGFRNSPSGERLAGAKLSIKTRAPVSGGNFGMWGGLFSGFDCAVKGVRKRGHLERYHCRVLHRWYPCHQRWLEIHQKRCHHLWYPDRVHRGCWVADSKSQHPGSCCSSNAC